MSILDKNITFMRTNNEILMEEKIFDELVYRIHQLEKENERLKDSRDWWKDRFFGQQEYDDSHRITAIEYKKRIDKAIGLIYDYQMNDEDNVNYKELLNILKNGSDDNE